MKKLLLVLLPLLLLSSCKTNEEKAAELIKNELSKTLYDFESYSPIETSVNVAKISLYNDTALWNKGVMLANYMKETLEYMDKSEKAKELMELWGKPSYYSSSYSDNKYYKFKDEYTDAIAKVIVEGALCKVIAQELRDTLSKIDTTQVIGWEVSHRFRCKTRGGNAAIGDYRYIIDKDFKKVLLREDKDDKDDQYVRMALGTVLTDYWDELFKN